MFKVSQPDFKRTADSLRLILVCCNIGRAKKGLRIEANERKPINLYEDVNNKLKFVSSGLIFSCKYKTFFNKYIFTFNDNILHCTKWN